MTTLCGMCVALSGAALLNYWIDGGRDYAPVFQLFLCALVLLVRLGVELN